MLKALDDHLEAALACACLAVVAFCIIAQVLLRYGFGTALTWTEELAGYAMVGAVYMGASLAVRERFHIRIMVGVVALPRALGLPVLLASDLVWLAFNVFMLWVLYDYLVVLWERPTISTALGVNQFWPNLILPLGFVLMTFRLLQLYWRWARDDFAGLPGVGDEYADLVGEQGAKASQ